MREPTNQPVLGSFYMMLAMALYVCNDSIVKLVGEDISLGTILTIRGVFAVGLIFIFVIATPNRVQWSLMFHKQVLLRASLDTAATFLFLTALLNLSIAIVTSILQIIPLVVVLFGAIFLKESIGWRRILAIIVGFAGVLLIIKPGAEGFNAYALLALATVFLVAFRDTVTRKIPAETPSLLITMMNVVMVTIAGSIYAAFNGFDYASTNQVLLLGLAAVFLVGATLVAILTMRVADMTTTAPFRYSAILWSLMAAFLVFGETPDKTAIIGILMIAVSGVYALNRVQKS